MVLVCISLQFSCTLCAVHLSAIRSVRAEALPLGCKTEIFMAQELDNKQKKEWAKLLFLTTDFTQAEIAAKVGVSRITIVRWAKEWEGLKLNLLQTREERIGSTLQQLDELDRAIASREPGRASLPESRVRAIRRQRRRISGANSRPISRRSNRMLPCVMSSMYRETFSTTSGISIWKRPRCSRTISIHTYRNG